MFSFVCNRRKAEAVILRNTSVGELVPETALGKKKTTIKKSVFHVGLATAANCTGVFVSASLQSN